MNYIFSSVLATVLLFSAAAVFSQTGGVSISKDERVPHPSAQLDISSSRKGVLPPRVPHLMMKTISPLADGLLIYNIDSIPRGLWYYNEHEEKWLQLLLDDGTPDVVTPVGGIVMYSGPVTGFNANGIGTGDMEGWLLCNGQNNTPNLEGRFIVGGKKENSMYNMVGGTGGEDKHTVTLNQMPAHNHPIDQAKIKATIPPHSHSVNDPGHSHKFYTDNGGGAHVADKGGNQERGDYYTHKDPANISVAEAGGIAVVYNFQNGFIGTTGGGEAYENRPEYYVLCFIIRANSSNNSAGFTSPVNYNY